MPNFFKKLSSISFGHPLSWLLSVSAALLDCINAVMFFHPILSRIVVYIPLYLFYKYLSSPVFALEPTPPTKTPPTEEEDRYFGLKLVLFLVIAVGVSYFYFVGLSVADLGFTFDLTPLVSALHSSTTHSLLAAALTALLTSLIDQDYSFFKDTPIDQISYKRVIGLVENIFQDDTKKPYKKIAGIYNLLFDSIKELCKVAVTTYHTDANSRAIVNFCIHFTIALFLKDEGTNLLRLGYQEQKIAINQQWGQVIEALELKSLLPDTTT